MKFRKVLPYVACALIVVQLLMVLVSWIWSAAVPDSGVRSMLSGEGIRWFLGHSAEMLATPLLVWLLLMAASIGCMMQSGVLKKHHSFRAGRARVITLLFLVGYVGVVLLMTVVPHAVLLSASGNLWPSPFSASLFPVVAFGMLMASVIYGIIAGTFMSLADIYESLLNGLRLAAPFLMFYILLTQLCNSLIFIFG